jgi:hypothetical protein
MSTKISQLTSATDITASDLMQIVDVEDGVMAPSGTNKKITAQLLADDLAGIVSAGSIATSKLASGALPSGVTVSSTNIVNGTIVNNDISSSAAIAFSKLESGALPSDITVASANIVNGTIVDADINASAAIAGSKISPSFTEPSVISVNSSSNALRITQTGTGDALVVEDSTNPDATPFVVNSSGNTIIGNTDTFETRFGTASASPPLQVIGTSLSSASTLGARFSDDSFASSAFFAKSRSTNRGEHAIVSTGDALGNISFSGSDGTKMVEAARIIARVDDSPAESDMAGRIEFHTTPSGGQLVGERMRITSAGNVGIGTNNPGARLEVARLGADQVIPSLNPNTAILATAGGGTTMSGTTLTLAGGSASLTGVAFGDIDHGEMGALYYENTNDAMAFRVNADERMRITSTGNVGIGTISPSSKLHVAGDLTMSSATVATSATAGTNGDVPAQVAGYLVVNINGTARKIPYYA